MNDVARSRLGEFIQAYGPSVCNTPTMCQIMLNQYCGSYPDEMKALNGALTGGAVSRLLKAKPGEPWNKLSEPLVEDLAKGGMAEDQSPVGRQSRRGGALGKRPEGVPHVAEPTITAIERNGKPADETGGGQGGELYLAGCRQRGGRRRWAHGNHVRRCHPCQRLCRSPGAAGVQECRSSVGLVGSRLRPGRWGWRRHRRCGQVHIGRGAAVSLGGPSRVVSPGALLAAAIGGRAGGLIGVFLGSSSPALRRGTDGAYNSLRLDQERTTSPATVRERESSAS